MSRAGLNLPGGRDLTLNGVYVEGRRALGRASVTLERRFTVTPPPFALPRRGATGH